jgi:pyridoxal phosphate enzyme (YggS family)
VTAEAPGNVGDRYRAVQQRLARACQKAGRSPDEVVLVGASKRQSMERLLAAWQAGLRVFGENRVQEAEVKRPQMPSECDWHLLGPLQSNKVRKAVRLFGTVHSVDRLKIGRALDREAERIGATIDGFLEVNLGDEPSKHGFSPLELPQQAGDLAGLEHLRIVGLMAIPPFEPDPMAARAWFDRLAELRDELADRPEWSTFPGHLSMGMSHDFELAVAAGATHVRVGTDLFGPRP